MNPQTSSTVLFIRSLILVYGLAGLAFAGAGCSIVSKHGDKSEAKDREGSSRDSKSDSPITDGYTESKPHLSEPGEVPEELSLKSDRSQLDDLRKEIPDQIKRTNDELALIFQIMGDKGGDEEPSLIRDRFDKAMRSRREKNDKNLRRLREDYSKSEKRTRDDFLEQLKKQREKFMSKKVTPDERKRFFEDQDQSRRDFFADQADKRKEFESAMQDGRKTFEDYAREKQNQFNQELRSYTSNYYDRRKNLDLKHRAEERAKEKKAEEERAQAASERSRPTPDPDDEFMSIPKGGGSMLGPADDGK